MRPSGVKVLISSATSRPSKAHRKSYPHPLSRVSSTRVNPSHPPGSCNLLLISSSPRNPLALCSGVIGEPTPSVVLGEAVASPNDGLEGDTSVETKLCV